MDRHEAAGKKSNADELRARMLELMNELEDDWDGEGSKAPSHDAFYQTQMMLMLMETIFEQDILDMFWIFPLQGDGGFFIEFLYPHDTKESSELVLRSSSHFDTYVDNNGSVSIWRMHGLRYNPDTRKLEHDDEFDSDTHQSTNADNITLWKEHANIFNTHMREIVDAAS